MDTALLRKLLAWLLLATTPAAASTVDLLPSFGDEVPQCYLKRTDTQFVLLAGNQEVKRFTYSAGPNIVESSNRSDRALLDALEALSSLRREDICR